MGITMAFKEMYGDEAFDIAKKFIKQIEINIGNLLLEVYFQFKI